MEKTEREALGAFFTDLIIGQSDPQGKRLVTPSQKRGLANKMKDSPFEVPIQHVTAVLQGRASQIIAYQRIAQALGEEINRALGQSWTREEIIEPENWRRIVRDAISRADAESRNTEAVTPGAEPEKKPNPAMKIAPKTPQKGKRKEEREIGEEPSEEQKRQIAEEIGKIRQEKNRKSEDNQR